MLFIARAILLQWFASVAMLETKRVWPFLPLLFYSVAFSGLATLFYYDVLLTFWQAIFVSMVFATNIWVLAVIIRLTGKKP